MTCDCASKDRNARQVLYLQAVIREGSAKAAASALNVRPQHVKNTLSQLYRRLDVTSINEAVYVLWLKDLWEATE